MYLANPAIAGGVAGAILFGLLTIFELDRGPPQPGGTSSPTRGSVSPDHGPDAPAGPADRGGADRRPHHAGLAPYQRRADRAPCSPGANYVLAYLLFMGLGAAPWASWRRPQPTSSPRRADLAIVLFIAFCALSLTVWAADWQLCWLNPCVWALSDDFSNLRVFRSVAWMRLTWLPCTGRGFGQSPISASGSMERVFSAPWPGACGGSTARPSPWRCWPVPAPPMPPSPSSTTATRI